MCGAKIDDREINTAQKDSIFLKYADFLDNEMLYRIACAKSSGLIRAAVPGEAAEIFRLLAFRGHTESMYRYAEICLSADPPDKETAYQWMKIAADAGHAASKNHLKNENIPYEEPKTPPAAGAPAVSAPGDFESLVADALPAVMKLTVMKTENGQRMASLGSAFAVEGGYVITNAHVVGEDPECVVATFEPNVDECRYNLLPLRINPRLDVAILKFTGLAAKKMEERRQLSLRMDRVEYGERVYTIGNPLGLGLSVSQGVVSCPDREAQYPPDAQTVIQTDITINHGNSGGALLDAANRVIGMVTFIPGDSEGGIGMCLPAKYIVDELNQLQTK